jgi:predicted DCC family thiol-disulfide oxidoreductase YuxK
LTVGTAGTNRSVMGFEGSASDLDKKTNYGTIIYDGSCGVCSATVGKRYAFFERYGFAVLPLQTEGLTAWVGETETVLMTAIHLKTSDGRLLKGPECVIEVASKIWWMWPFYITMKIPLCKKLLGWAYAQVAKRRQKISGVCGFTKPKSSHTYNLPK